MVWKCPVCSHTQPVQPEVCSVCGYEESADREKYPTLTCPAKNVSSRSGKIWQREAFRRQKEQERRARQLREQQEESRRQKEQEEQERKECQLQEQQKQEERLEQKQEEFLAESQEQNCSSPASLLFIGGTDHLQREEKAKKSLRGRIWGIIVAVSSALMVTLILGLILPFQAEERELYGGIYTGTAVFFGFSPKEGQMLYPNGNTYEGKWNVNPDGYGVYTLADGTRYEGEWEQGKLIQEITKDDQTKLYHGIYVLSGGAAYIGTWTETWFSWNRIGQGTMYYSDGGVYAGEWGNDMRNGQGILTWPDGNQYEGGFVEDVITGYGVYTWSNGNRYEGEWVNGTINGSGVYTWQSGARFEGEWVDGSINGPGVYTWPNGDRFEGEWINDEQTSLGTMYYADGTQKTGTLESGGFVAS